MAVIALLGAAEAEASDKAACQYHPNPAENQLMANQLVAELKTRLGW